MSHAITLTVTLTLKELGDIHAALGRDHDALKRKLGVAAAEAVTSRMTITDAAERYGIAPATFRAYVTRGQAPKPDGQHDARTPWWYASTLDAWRTPPAM